MQTNNNSPIMQGGGNNNSHVPMTSAALPPRVTRPSTAPATKPHQNRNVTTNNTTNAAANQQQQQQQQQHLAMPTAIRSRPSSAHVVLGGASRTSTRPFASNFQQQRPSSGYSTRPSSGGTARSIATTTPASAHVSNVVSMSNRSAAVSSVKGDILLLQRTVDRLSSGNTNKNNNASSSDFPQKDGLFEVEQILQNEFPPLLPGDEVLAADMHAKLLELFVQRLNQGCIEALNKIDPDCVEEVSLVSRTSAINTLLQKIGGGDENSSSNLLGGVNSNNGNNNNGKDPSSFMMNRRNNSSSHVQTQTHSIGGLSAPEITDFQVLLKEQREIQSQMKNTLLTGRSGSNSNNNNINVPPLPTTSAATTSKGERAQVRALKEQLEEAQKIMNELRSESSSLQSKLSKSESERKSLQQELHKEKVASSEQQQSSSQQQGRTNSNKSMNNNNSRTTSKDLLGNNNNKKSSSGGGGVAPSSSGGAESGDDGGRFSSRANSTSSVAGGTSSSHHQDENASGNNNDPSQTVVMLNKMTPENALIAALGASVGFFRLDPEILSQVGLDSLLTDTPRYVPDRQYCEQIYSKVSGAISELLVQVLTDENLLDPAQTNSSNKNGASNNNNLFSTSINKLAATNSAVLMNASTIRGSKSTKRDKNENSPEALSAKLGSLWWILEKQNATVQAMQLLLAKQHDQLEKNEKDHDALDKRSKRMISVLEEKLGHAKSVVQRLMEENEMLVKQQEEHDQEYNGNHSDNNNNNNNGRDSRASDSSSNNHNNNNSRRGRWGPHVRSSIDEPTPEEERKLYEKNELRLQRRILELEHTNSESHAFVEQAKLNAAATHREIQVLKARVQYLEKELDGRKLTEDKAVTEATRLRDEREGNKKDLREKSISATEASQKVNRLEVELHIAQNIVSDLRQRELQLEKTSSGAKECQDILKQKMIGERETHARELARLREENRAAKHEVVVANQILADERQKAVANEREIERLRGLDLQLEALQQNFANYAGAKQAQKEAQNEEERALQACVELIGQDVFALPFDESQGEEEVELLLHRLKDSEESMAAEERTRDTLRNTVVGFRDERSGRKQLATLMQRRYNAIQVFACEQRLRQLQLEQRLQEALVQNDEHRVQYEGAMVELSHARSHEQALLQRNSELEQQRRETLKNKDGAEGEVKTLKQTIQRMRIANEEQEAAIVDLGTKLKRKEYADEKNGNSNGSDSLSQSAGSLRASGRRH